MTKHLLKFLPFTFLFFSCEKNNFDSTYPTTFKVVSSESISQMRASFSSNNKYLTTTLNEFGFMVPPMGDVWVDNFLISTKGSTNVSSKVKQNQPIEFNIQKTSQFDLNKIKNQ